MNFILLLSWLLFHLGTTLPRQRSPNPHIVGGVDTDISEVPYQAALLWGDHYFCGAAIISDKYLITGAHCIAFFLQMTVSGGGLGIRVGSNYSEKGGVLLTSKNTACHPSFDFDNYDYDICLIEVNKKIIFDENVRAVKIGEVEPEEGEIGRVAGWGTLWEGGSTPERLQSVLVPVTNKTYCQQAYQNICPITERMFCAGDTGKDSCQGDSGGGLVVNGTLRGVISTGYGCGAPGYPGVYTSLAHPQIRNYIKEVSGL